MDAGERGLATVSRRRPGRLLERASANIEACLPPRPVAAKAEAPLPDTAMGCPGIAEPVPAPASPAMRASAEEPAIKPEMDKDNWDAWAGWRDKSDQSWYGRHRGHWVSMPALPAPPAKASPDSSAPRDTGGADSSGIGDDGGQGGHGAGGVGGGHGADGGDGGPGGDGQGGGDGGWGSGGGGGGQGWGNRDRWGTGDGGDGQGGGNGDGQGDGDGDGQGDGHYFVAGYANRVPSVNPEWCSCRSPPGYKLFIGDLPPDMDEATLKQNLSATVGHEFLTSSGPINKTTFLGHLAVFVFGLLFQEPVFIYR